MRISYVFLIFTFLLGACKERQEPLKEKEEPKSDANGLNFDIHQKQAGGLSVVEACSIGMQKFFTDSTDLEGICECWAPKMIKLMANDPKHMTLFIKQDFNSFDEEMKVRVYESLSVCYEEIMGKPIELGLAGE